MGIYFLIHVIIPGGTVAKNLPVNVEEPGGLQSWGCKESATIEHMHIILENANFALNCQ